MTRYSYNINTLAAGGYEVLVHNDTKRCYEWHLDGISSKAMAHLIGTIYTAVKPLIDILKHRNTVVHFKPDEEYEYGKGYIDYGYGVTQMDEKKLYGVVIYDRGGRCKACKYYIKHKITAHLWARTNIWRMRLIRKRGVNRGKSKT